MLLPLHTPASPALQPMARCQSVLTRVLWRKPEAPGGLPCSPCTTSASPPGAEPHVPSFLGMAARPPPRASPPSRARGPGSRSRAFFLLRHQPSLPLRWVIPTGGPPGCCFFWLKNTTETRSPSALRPPPTPSPFSASLQQNSRKALPVLLSASSTLEHGFERLRSTDVSFFQKML